MLFKVLARQYGDSVEFEVDAADTKGALLAARAEARSLFGYKASDANAPTVAVKPVSEE